MLHRKSEIRRLQTTLDEHETTQSRSNEHLLQAADMLLSDIQDTISTDRSNIIERIDASINGLYPYGLSLPRRHMPDYLSAARLNDADVLRFTSSAPLSDHLHTLIFQTVPMRGRRHPIQFKQDQVRYRRDTINEDSQLIPSVVESDNLSELVKRPDFLMCLGRAATLIQLAESGQTVTVRPLTRRTHR